ncbi:MAG: hypothetical protein AcusKO_35070 [Acuticoccus sp.]
MVRRFRVELFESRRAASTGAPALPPSPPPMSHHVDQILGELNDLRKQVNSGDETPADNQSLESAIAVWSGVDDIQRRLEITKAEISALESKGIGNEEKTSRTTDELRAVITGTEEATDTILAAAEAIDEIAQRMASGGDEEAKKDGQVICDSVIQIFEACNFQDISGQRITKVVESLRFIEERIASMIDVWQTINKMNAERAGAAPPPPVPAAEVPPDKKLLNGPSLKTDPGVVSQDDVDAMFP